MEKLLDVYQVAGIIGCSWRTVFRWADTGQFPYGIKVGALRRWTADQVREHLSQLQGVAPAKAE